MTKRFVLILLTSLILLGCVTTGNRGDSVFSDYTIVEAESAQLLNDAMLYGDTSASGSQGVAYLDVIGRGISIKDHPGGTKFSIRYASQNSNPSMALYINDKFIEIINLESTGTWLGIYKVKSFDIATNEGDVIKLITTEDTEPINIDCLFFHGETFEGDFGDPVLDGQRDYREVGPEKVEYKLPQYYTFDKFMKGKFTPPDDKMLFFIGQDIDSVKGYIKNVDKNPSGTTTYTGISEGGEMLLGLRDVVDYTCGDVGARTQMEMVPNSVLSIGLYIVDNSGTNLLNIANGTYDDNIRELGHFIMGTGGPVYLRIGYEIDGPWNHYEPEEFVGAWRRIVDVLNEMKCDNVAYVWQSCTHLGGRYKDYPLRAWWPGDEYVDWLGLSYFIHEFDYHEELLELARVKNKPVMISEATPQFYQLDERTYTHDQGAKFWNKTDNQIWNEWYYQFFTYIYDNRDVIRAVAYINCDWDAQYNWGAPNYPSGYWGDTRIEKNRKIKKLWKSEMSRDMWLNADENLNTLLGWN